MSGYPVVTGKPSTRGHSGRKPGRPSKNGFFWALQYVQMRDPRAFKKMTPDERRKARNKRKAARQAARR